MHQNRDTVSQLRNPTPSLATCYYFRPVPSCRLIPNHEDSRVSSQSHPRPPRCARPARGGGVLRPGRLRNRPPPGLGALSSSRPRFTPAAAARPAASRSSSRPMTPRRRPRTCSGRTLVTYQTGPEGQKVSRLLLEEGLAIDRELYLGTRRRSLDAAAVADGQHRGRRRHRRGGREDAGEDPQGLLDPGLGLAPFQAQQLAFAVGLTGDSVKKATR